MKTITTLLLLILTGPAFSQTKIFGRVTDVKGEAIPGANVFLVNTYDGTSTDADGKFEFKTDETGRHILTVKFVGYKEFNSELELTGKSVTISVALREEISELKAVTITAGAFAASDESRRTIFRALDIATTAGATADIAGALNTLPGTQKVGESGRLFVRGGDGYETRTFIDGLAVMDAYSPAAPNTPSRGRFLPFMFKGTSFSTGGYSAEYGQALSSALVLDSKDNAEATRTDIGIMSVGGDMAHTQAWRTGSVAGKIEYTNIRPYVGLIDQEVDWRTPPAAVEGSTAFRQRLGNKGMVKVYGNFSHSDFSLYNHDIADPNLKQLFNLTNDYRYVNGFYKQAVNARWSVRGGVSYTFSRNDIAIDNVKILETDKGLHMKSVLEGSLSDKVELRTGLEVYHLDHTLKASSETLAFTEILTAGFVESDIFTSNSFVTRAGARVEHNNLLNKISVDPRLSLAYKVAEGQVSLAYGKFRQSPKNEWLRVNNSLQSEKADHYILNYQRISNNRTFRIETYFKQYDDLIKFSEAPTAITNKGNGYAKGVELFWRDNRSIKNVDYWVSYSYLNTERDYRNTPHAVTPSFASAHNFSVVYKHFVSSLKTQFGATYSFTSGRPYHDPNTEKFNSKRTPAYQDLSVNISYLPTSQVIVYFSCTNVLGYENIFGYEFATTPDANGVFAGRSIGQPAPRFLFLGIFITLSKEKTINQLPAL
jgi:hypothetical protein